METPDIVDGGDNVENGDITSGKRTKSPRIYPRTEDMMLLSAYAKALRTGNYDYTSPL